MIPTPKENKPFESFFKLPKHLKVGFDATDEIMDSFLENLDNDWYLKSFDDAELGALSGTMQVEFRLKDLKLPHPDGYEIHIKQDKISCFATNALGFHHALSSLEQLFYLALKHNGAKLQVQSIRDWPSYPWRGMHLDVSRHIFDPHEIIAYSGWMKKLKMNQLHLHLSDDQGWRLKLERHPKLVEKGAWRKHGKHTLYGGYYEEADIKEILLSLEHFRINVTPEIDLPGHAMAILSAYPQYACFPREFEPLNVWGISDDIICAGNDEAVSFLKDLVLEVAKLFPGPYFHIGGDEAPKQRWKECPKCQERIKQLGLKDENALQGWLVRELQHTLKQVGKTIIAWDEILDAGVDSSPLVSVWRGDGLDAAKKAVENGNSFILCPNHYFYFDWRASEDAPGHHGVTTMEKVMSFELQNYTFDHPELLLGGQANMWTEHTPEFKDIKKMIFPRIFAAAEVFWNGKVDPDLPQRIAKLQGAYI